MDLGHWIFDQDFEIEDWFGFIYRIVENQTGREYIGKKQFFNTRRKIIKGRKNRKVMRIESDWKTYTSSSEHLNAAIKTNGIENYSFYIESLHKTKGSLHYAEIRCQITEDVLRTKLDSGIPKYYNRQIAGIKFIPPDEMSEETKMKIKMTLIEKYKIEPHWRATLSDEQRRDLIDRCYAGNNHYLYRLMTAAERESFLTEHLRGENNPIHSIEHPNKGKSYFDIHGKECSYAGITMEERYGIERAKIIKELQKKNRPDVSGDKNSFYGRSHSPEQIEIWKSDPRRAHTGENNGMYGKPCYYKMSDDEVETWKKKIGDSIRGVPKPKSMCPHCEKYFAHNILARFHNDKCKSKK